MPKHKSIRVTVSRRVSDDNFGSYGAEISEEIELEDGDNTKDVREALKRRVLKETKSLLDDTVALMKKEKKR